jgi:hypothetical protein
LIIFITFFSIFSHTEFHTLQHTWLNTILTKPGLTHLIDKICVFINNHYAFCYLLTDTVENWAYDIEDNYMLKISEKLEFSLNNSRNNAKIGGEIITQYIYNDIKDILKNEKNGLFVKSWENSVKSITLLKGCLRKTLAVVCSNLCIDYTGGLEMKQNIVYYACESVISIYIELLLCCPTINIALTECSLAASNTGTQSNILERLMEDIEMLTKLFEELRTTRALEESCIQAPIIYNTIINTTNNTKDTKITPHGRRRLFRRTTNNTNTELKEKTSSFSTTICGSEIENNEKGQDGFKERALSMSSSYGTALSQAGGL